MPLWAWAGWPHVLHRQMTSRLLIALLGSLAFGAVGLADDLARIRGRYPNGLGLGLRRTQRLALECIAAALVLGLLALNGCLPTGLILPGAGYVECALAPLLWAVLLVAMAEAARVADGADGTVCGAAFVAMLGLMMLEAQLGCGIFHRQSCTPAGAAACMQREPLAAFRCALATQS